MLATLLRHGHPYRITPVDLARTAMISTSAVAQRLNKLEQRGFISRQVNPGDGRGTLVALTDSGRAIIETALPHHLATEHAITAALSPTEQAHLVTLLQRLQHAARIAAHSESRRESPLEDQV